LFAFGLFTRWQIKYKWAPLICATSPVLCYIVSAQSEELLGGYKFGFELLILNGLLTFFGLWVIRKGTITVNPMPAHV
jgi:hypothetical protein